MPCGRLRLSAITLALIITLTLGKVTVVDAQASAGRMAYIQTIDDAKRVVVVEGMQRFEFEIPNNNCYALSPHLDFIAQVNYENPTELAVFNLLTSERVFMVAWQADWQWNCGLEWLNEQTLLMWTNWPPTNTVYQISLPDGTLIGPITYSPLAALPNVNPEFPDPEFPDFVSSPSGHEYVYSYCGAITSPATPTQCANWQEYVIYSIPQERIMTELEDTLLLFTTHPLPLILFFAWSPSGRYLAYEGETNPVNIYDVTLDEYVNTHFDETIWTSVEVRPSGLIWSPDENKLAFTVSRFVGAPSMYVEGIGIADLKAHTFTELDVSRDNWPYGSYRWAWSFDGQSILVIRANHQLVQIDLTGNIEVIADDVTDIYSWYPGNSDTAVTTPLGVY